MIPNSPSQPGLQPVGDTDASPPALETLQEPPDEDEEVEPTWMGVFGIGMSVICGGGLAVAVIWILLSGFVSLDPAHQLNPPPPPQPEVAKPPPP
ncbi:hypothetical protein Isop_3238 [Isosphaera pallida ATCC 43644]|uniref:Uncharacterized protein n=1 Tax=Isosphaera pallida (strain ATCC 43644 / DSM 9630 / IS1B) TaxID=575540 RepID=E8R4K5_ISOPI|nr:hypothetical protein [Isosphaera pallida]ADV63800.1 hypothetical protein Isop_3238 [Isosphaera pallida ATCC 43644]